MISESYRDRIASEVAEKVDAYNNRENMLKEYIANVKSEIDSKMSMLSEQVSVVSYKLNDLIHKPVLEDEDGNKFNTELLSDADRIDYLELSVRSYNSLKRGGVNMIGDLRSMGLIGLGRVRNLGRRSIDEIVTKVLSRTGIPLK